MLDVWQGWHRVGAPMRDRYARFVELSNNGARELGHPNTGAMWRAQYEMHPDSLAAEVDRLWAQVRPLYESLHAYVRARLVEQYGPRRGTSQRDDPRAPAGEHVGAGVGEHLPASWRRGTRRTPGST